MSDTITTTTAGDSIPSEMANDGIFSSLISDVKAYTGRDPLLPWLRGIRKMKDTLPPDALKEKLPGFLQQCAQMFETDRRYSNDLRYLRVWLHLMDYVDDPTALLRTMEVNHIGTKRCQFYQAYALYYEKTKRYGEAEKMYLLGVNNLAEPMDELQKSYEQFLNRMERKNNKRIQQDVIASRRPLSTKNIPHDNKIKGKNEACGLEGVHIGPLITNSVAKGQANDRHVKTKKDECKRFSGEDTVVVKFIDTAIVGKSEAEDACHHGLVDPTINLKEAMNAINSMFREPLEDVPVARKSQTNQSKNYNSTQNEIEIFIDENLDNGIKLCDPSSLQHRTEVGQPHQEPFFIYIDDEGCSKASGMNDENNQEQDDARNLAEDSSSSAPPLKAFVRSENCGEMDAESSRNSKFREDTVVCRFVGSAILDGPEVENVCHHGLVDPTINMKEAMDDINNMFGKPIDYMRRKRSKKEEKEPETKSTSKIGFNGFSVLADDDLEHQEGPPPTKFPGNSEESDLFEPTLLTKEAMDDINKMFNMPLN